MYICLCRAVSEKDIRDAVEKGVKNYRQLVKCTGLGTECGTCAKYGRAAFDQAVATKPAQPIRLRLVTKTEAG